MGAKKNVNKVITTDTVKHVKVTDSTSAEVKADVLVDSATDSSEVKGSTHTEATDTNANSDTNPEVETAKTAKQGRSKKYVTVRAKLDRTKLYSIADAVKIVQELSYSKFDGTISVDGVVKEVGNLGNITFPHSTGQTRRVVIVDDQVLADIDAGKIEFDVLVAHPQFMPKLAKHARVLGPKGLMPNPKVGTLTPNPEAKKKELEAGVITIKTEKKAPVIHLIVGKVSTKPEMVVENIEELTKVLGTRLRKLSISASMSPGVRIKLDSRS